MYSLTEWKPEDRAWTKWRASFRAMVDHLNRGTFLHRVAVTMLVVGLASGTGAQQSNAQSIDVELVTLRDGGFYPPKITPPAGAPFLLIVLIRAHTGNHQLGINRNSDASVIAEQEQVNDWNKSYVLTLPAETYVLKDWTHKDWATLTIVTH